MRLLSKSPHRKRTTAEHVSHFKTRVHRSIPIVVSNIATMAAEGR